MRKVALIAGLVVVGAAAGLLAAVEDGIGLKSVMMVIGAIAGAAIGGALSRIGNRKVLEHDSIRETDFSIDDRMSTYWRDKGEIYPMPGHPDPEGARRELP